MGSGARAYRTMMGESQAIQEHQLAMIPIMKQQAEIQLEIQEKAFVQELEQTKRMNLLSQQLQPEPVLVPAKKAVTKPVTTNYLIYAGLAALAFFLLRKK